MTRAAAMTAPMNLPQTQTLPDCGGSRQDDKRTTYTHSQFIRSDISTRTDVSAGSQRVDMRRLAASSVLGKALQSAYRECRRRSSGGRLVVGFEPAKLPAALLNIAVYKLAFAAAAGLLAAGAIVQRYARRDDRSPIDNAKDAEGQPRSALTNGGAEADLSGNAGERAKVKVSERP